MCFPPTGARFVCKTVAWGLGLQIAFALFVLQVDIGRRILPVRRQRSEPVCSSYSFEGSKFVFGELGKQGSSLGFFFAFQVLPTIIFIAAFLRRALSLSA